MLTCTIFAACGGKATNPVDARPQGGADAALTIDARPGGTADAAPGGTADAAPGGTADAPLSSPDARPVDAPPSSPDAPAPPDASPADAGMTGACLPQCFVDINVALIASCPPMEPCQSSVFDLQNPFSFAVCYANGVKLIGSVNVGTGTTTFLAKEADGDTCYSYEASGTAENATILIKNRDGAQVARIVVPDNSEPDIQQYFCGEQGPFEVDLSSPACQDTGEFGDTSDCPMNASCTP